MLSRNDCRNRSMWKGTPPGLMTGILPRLYAAGSAELNVNGRKHGRIGRPMQGI
ncbi:hypothetical protein [Sphingobacterium zeae]|uniref:Uncharacterized protein n=1 Tax=Sphingobacterium zeae TaxID=1776859 RepID=A0ABU0UC83_9SPHI|nr:hypothetical protein [Sphingobacterium zeae]MDQ1152473.1 hypothetical protein [Sphingobacterium zeae]